MRHKTIKAGFQRCCGDCGSTDTVESPHSLTQGLCFGAPPPSHSEINIEDDANEDDISDDSLEDGWSYAGSPPPVKSNRNAAQYSNLDDNSGDKKASTIKETTQIFQHEVIVGCWYCHFRHDKPGQVDHLQKHCPVRIADLAKSVDQKEEWSGKIVKLGDFPELRRYKKKVN